MNSTSGVYVHIPFCRQKCLYCDFPSITKAETYFDDYITALCREIAGKGGILSECEIDTIYFGGGTPTLLPPEYLCRIIDCLRSYGNVRHGAEITFEANPGTLSEGKLHMLRYSAGFNRISIGVQAFDDAVLKSSGRIHDAVQATQAVLDAAKYFDNIGIDLIYGLPGQSAVNFIAGLRQAALLPVKHFSVYGLKVEENTAFYEMQAEGNLALPDEDEETAMYDFATDFLASCGYKRYEVSNYAIPGFECLHNLKYWQYEPYIGFGAAAHSFWQGERLANITDITKYIACIENGDEPVFFREKTDVKTAMAEYCFLALRTTQGLSLRKFNSYFSADFFRLFARQVESFAERGLLTVKGDSITLTEQGFKYGNVVFAGFLPDA